VYGDPGVLVAELVPLRHTPDVPIGVVPHYSDRGSPWLDRCRALGIGVLDVLSPLEEFLLELQRCEVILSSSLHGIIFAHAYGRRAAWIELSDAVLGGGFKFFDYYASIGIPPQRVVRNRISQWCDPREIARGASAGDQVMLVRGLEIGITEAAAWLAKATTDR
jgi:pyruvyltransferase